MQTGRRLILNDGTVIENGEAGYSQGFLWLWFSGYTLPEAARMAFDPYTMLKIIYQYGEMQDEYTDYTNCITLQIDVDGKISVCMTKGA